MIRIRFVLSAKVKKRFREPVFATWNGAAVKKMKTGSTVIALKRRYALFVMDQAMFQDFSKTAA
jgi:hypothetical protein